MEDYRTTDYIKAMAVMGEFKDQGVAMHCNLDDGYGAQFHDVANLLGWAKLERYMAEELMGGRVAHDNKVMNLLPFFALRGSRFCPGGPIRTLLVTSPASFVPRAAASEPVLSIILANPSVA